MQLLEAWGFTYKSAHIWRKPKIGTGFTTITKENLAENRDSLYKSSC